MAKRLSNRKGQAVKFLTNGKRGNDAYALFDHVGRIVKRTDVAAKRARASTARRAVSFARAEVLIHFNIKPGKLAKRYRTEITGDSIRLYASQRRIPLMEFDGRWAGRKSPGATAEIEHGSRATYSSAFISTGPFENSKKSIRIRQTVAGKKVRRGPLNMLYGPSPHDMITGLQADPETRTPVGRYRGDVRTKVLDRLIRFHTEELRRLYALEDAKANG